MQLVDDGGLADAGISGDEHQLRRATRDDAVEGCEQGVDRACSPVQCLGNQEPVWRVVRTQGERIDPPPQLPCSQALAEVGLDTRRGLIAFLSGLGEEFHDDGRDRCRDTVHPLAGRHRLSRDMAVHPLHGIGGRKGQTAGEHFIQGDAERIEIAAGIHGVIHASGLFGCHVGECPRHELGRFGRLALARQARRDPKAHQPGLARRGVHEHIGRLDVLMDEPPSV